MSGTGTGDGRGGGGGCGRAWLGQGIDLPSLPADLAGLPAGTR
jgi:hypothetical protein